MRSENYIVFRQSAKSKCPILMIRDSKRTKSSPSRNIPAVLRYVESMCSCFQGLESNCSVIGEVLAHCALCDVKKLLPGAGGEGVEEQRSWRE